jgi:hypothetical protein
MHFDLNAVGSMRSSRANLQSSVLGLAGHFRPCQRWQEFGGVEVSSLEAVVSLGHAVAMPVWYRARPGRRRLYDVCYLPVHKNVPHGMTCYLHEDFLEGGCDLALFVPERGHGGVSDILARLHEQSLKLHRANSFVVDVAAPAHKMPHLLVVDSRYGPVRGAASLEGSRLLVQDVGYPGLSGSAAYDDEGRFVGIYAARLPSLNTVSREMKLNQVIQYVLCGAGFAKGIDLKLQIERLMPPEALRDETWRLIHKELTSAAKAINRLRQSSKGDQVPRFRQSSKGDQVPRDRPVSVAHPPVVDQIPSPREGTNAETAQILDALRLMQASIQTMQTNIEHIEANMATKDDIANMATKDDIANVRRELTNEIRGVKGMLDDHVRRRAYVQPFHWKDEVEQSRTPFENAAEWMPLPERFQLAEKVSRVHAFDATTDVDVGMW